jgi:two-component system, OmpR family, sensor histidine kinase BaeS
VILRHPKLIWKLLAINCLALGIVLVVVWVSVHLLAAHYFMALVENYDISPSVAHAMFLQAVDRYLIVASVLGFVVAAPLSLWLSFRQTRPISQITCSARLIAAGNYDQRVTARGCGEVDQLGEAFNEMANSLQQAERLRKDFIVDVSHELRTPLTNILGYMEGLRDEVIASDKAVFSSIHEEAQRLTHLVEELLQLARADVARTNLRYEAIDLGQLIRQTIQSFNPRLSAKSLEVTCHASSPVEVMADSARMIQVTTNLLENACRYSRPGSKIDVYVERVANLIRVRMVNDADHEVPDTVRIFERFQRGDSSRSRHSGGAGLGLAIVKELIQAHGGQVGSEFRSGKAEFWFELPNRS